MCRSIENRTDEPVAIHQTDSEAREVPARQFYEEEAVNGESSVRHLDRQISTQFYEQLSGSKRNYRQGIRPETHIGLLVRYVLSACLCRQKHSPSASFCPLPAGPSALFLLLSNQVSGYDLFP